MKKKLRKLNTSGMDYQERLKVLEEYEPIQVGTVVYDSGDCWSGVEEVTVNYENRDQILMFWNSIYFDSYKKAERRNLRSRAEYSSFQEEAANGWFFTRR